MIFALANGSSRSTPDSVTDDLQLRLCDVKREIDDEQDDDDPHRLRIKDTGDEHVFLDGGVAASLKSESSVSSSDAGMVSDSADSVRHWSAATVVHPCDARSNGQMRPHVIYTSSESSHPAPGANHNSLKSSATSRTNRSPDPINESRVNPTLHLFLFFLFFPQLHHPSPSF